MKIIEAIQDGCACTLIGGLIMTAVSVLTLVTSVTLFSSLGKATMPNTSSTAQGASQYRFSPP